MGVNDYADIEIRVSNVFNDTKMGETATNDKLSEQIADLLFDRIQKKYPNCSHRMILGCQREINVCGMSDDDRMDRIRTDLEKMYDQAQIELIRDYEYVLTPDITITINFGKEANKANTEKQASDRATRILNKAEKAVKTKYPYATVTMVAGESDRVEIENMDPYDMKPILERRIRMILAGTRYKIIG